MSCIHLKPLSVHYPGENAERAAPLGNGLLPSRYLQDSLFLLGKVYDAYVLALYLVVVLVKHPVQRE